MGRRAHGDCCSGHGYSSHCCGGIQLFDLLSVSLTKKSSKSRLAFDLSSYRMFEYLFEPISALSGISMAFFSIYGPNISLSLIYLIIG